MQNMFVISDSENNEDDDYEEPKVGHKKLEATYTNFNRACDEVFDKKMQES